MFDPSILELRFTLQYSDVRRSYSAKEGHGFEWEDSSYSAEEDHSSEREDSWRGCVDLMYNIGLASNDD